MTDAFVVLQHALPQLLQDATTARGGRDRRYDV